MAVFAVHERAWPIAKDQEVTELFRAAQRGDEGALDALLARLRPWLVRYLTRPLDTDDANDWAQIGLVRITRAVRLDPKKPALYLLKVAANLRRTARKRRRRDAGRCARVALAYKIAAPLAYDLAVERDDLIGAVRRAVETLSPRLRPVVLGILEGLTPSDIAARHHLPPATVRTRLRRARALLVRRLTPYIDLTPPSDAPAAEHFGSRGLGSLPHEQNVFRNRGVE
jgi:RNA polymerase sigma factor (sigma-70 family)